MSGKEPKYKVGDKVRVVGNSADHDFKVGDEIEIIKEGSWHRHSFYYRAKNNNGAKWDIYESDLSPIEEQTDLVAEGQSLDGDSVVTPHSSSSNSIEQRGYTHDDAIYYEAMMNEWQSKYEDAYRKWQSDKKHLCRYLKALIKLGIKNNADIDKVLNNELPVQASVASKADSTTVRLDNNSEKTMTSKDHSRLKEGEGWYEKIENAAKKYADNWIDPAKNPEEHMRAKKHFEKGAMKVIKWLEPKVQVSKGPEQHLDKMNDILDNALKLVEKHNTDKKEQVSNSDLEGIIANYNNVEWDGEGDPVYGYAQVLEILKLAVHPLELQLREAKQEIERLKNK